MVEFLHVPPTATLAAGPIPTPSLAPPTSGDPDRAPLLTPARSLAALALLSTASVAGTVAFPALQGQPIALVALSPRLPFLVLAGDHVDARLLIPVVLVRLCLADVFHFHLGQHGATSRVVRRFGRLPLLDRPLPRRVGSLLRRHRRLAQRSVLLAVLLRPVGRHVALAGASGTCPRRTAAADVAGTLAYVLLVVGLTGLAT